MKATFVKTETNNVNTFLDGCIKHGVLTVVKARAIASALQYSSVDSMVVERMESGSVFVRYTRNSKNGAIGYSAHIPSSSKTCKFSIDE